MYWTKEREQLVMEKRASGMTYKAIGQHFGKSISSIKHKVRRLQQAQDQDRYKHTEEKQAQIKPYLASHQSILETHCGFGGMTALYLKHGLVTSWDLCQYKIDHMNEQFKGHPLETQRVDSEKEVYKAVATGLTWDVIDIDPYGFPSRLFPHIFRCFCQNGLLVMTFPVMGVAQINKITIRHYQAFWGINLSDKKEYIEKVVNRLKEYAFMSGRDIELLNVIKIDRIYRLILSVNAMGLDKLVGLKICRSNESQ